MARLRSDEVEECRDHRKYGLFTDAIDCKGYQTTEVVPFFPFSNFSAHDQNQKRSSQLATSPRPSTYLTVKLIAWTKWESPSAFDETVFLLRTLCIFTIIHHQEEAPATHTS